MLIAVQYNGNYIEEYNFFGPNELQVTSSALNGLNTGRDYSQTAQSGDCRVDFKIYWYETTDLWIDYVKVEDQYAHELFKGLTDNQLNNEMGTILNHSHSDIFTGMFTEEIQADNVSAVKYYNDLMAASFPQHPNARAFNLYNEMSFDWINTYKSNTLQYFPTVVSGMFPDAFTK